LSSKKTGSRKHFLLVGLGKKFQTYEKKKSIDERGKKRLNGRINNLFLEV